eukprot:1196350-Prorocentrum_minimum.AAC.9
MGVAVRQRTTRPRTRPAKPSISRREGYVAGGGGGGAASKSTSRPGAESSASSIRSGCCPVWMPSSRCFGAVGESVLATASSHLAR